MLGTIKRRPEEREPAFELLGTTFERVIDNIGKRTGTPEFPTGITALDEGIFGLHPAQLTVLAARPGIGKTALACQVALELAKKHKHTAFISLEMTKETILERMFCQEHAINGFNLIHGIMTKEIEDAMKQFYSVVNDITLRIIDDYCHTENELYTLVEHIKFVPQVMIIDHIQHIRGSSRQSQYETLTEYFRFLKEIAMKHKIAVLCLSQINRQGEDAPSLANLKGCGALEEMADHVIMMHQLDENTPYSMNFKMQIAKNRFGPVGTFDLRFDKSTLRFFNALEMK